MPGPLLTFEGIAQTHAVVSRRDSEGDVGPNHYIEAINETFKIFDKNGNTLSGPTSYNSFFAPLDRDALQRTRTTATHYVMYDQHGRSLGDERFRFPLVPGQLILGVHWCVRRPPTQ